MCRTFVWQSGKGNYVHHRGRYTSRFSCEGCTIHPIVRGFVSDVKHCKQERYMRSSLRSCFYALALAILLCSINLPIVAQTLSSGTLSGQVLDQQGSAVVGVDVLIVDPTTNISTKTTTNQAGRYTFNNVEPRTYR